MTSKGQQLSLFDNLSAEPEANQTPPAPPQPAPLDAARAKTPKLTTHSTLARAVELYREHIENSRLSPHTVKSFMYDLNILIEFATPARPIGQIAYRDLENFIDWLLLGRGVPCNAKSLSRRITTLKSFFKWLTETNA